MLKFEIRYLIAIELGNIQIFKKKKKNTKKQQHFSGEKKEETI